MYALIARFWPMVAWCEVLQTTKNNRWKVAATWSGCFLHA